MGDLRIEQDGSAVLLKFNNIVEAITAHNFLKANSVRICATDYISIRSWAEVRQLRCICNAIADDCFR
jgi:hypothetical protein